MEISDLIGRLLELQEPSRKLDLDIAIAAGVVIRKEVSQGSRIAYFYSSEEPPRRPFLSTPLGVEPSVGNGTPEYTSDIGHVYRLFRKLYPGWLLSMNEIPSYDTIFVRAQAPSYSEYPDLIVEGTGSSLAIAGCVALLEAVAKTG